MLQIRLRKPSLDGGATAKPVPVDSVTVACPDHLVLADLPVAKCVGSVSTAAVVKHVGHRSGRQLGERVHFCVRCDFPIAVYGRLSPCDHAFCRDCARSDSICYLCDESIQKIQTIKMMEGIFICAAPHCLKSFLKKSDFDSHIQEKHPNLLQSNSERDAGNELGAVSTKQTPSESTARAPTRAAFSPNSSSQGHDQPRDQQPQPPPHPYLGQMQHNLSDAPQCDNDAPPGFERAGPQNSVPQQNFDNQVKMQQPNFAVPIDSNQVVGPTQFGYPPIVPQGAHPFYEMAPGPGPVGNFPGGFPRPWNMMPAGVPFDQTDSQGRTMFFQGGGYGRNTLVLPSNMPLQSPGNRVMETGQDGKGILAPPPLPFPPPPPHQLPQRKQDNSYSDHMGA